MPRAARVAPGGVIFHVLNRANGRSRIFEKDLDYEAFKHVIGETAKKILVRILAYSIMPNHWHMVLWPLSDDDPNISRDGSPPPPFGARICIKKA